MDDETRESVQRLAASDLPVAKWAQALLLVEARDEFRAEGSTEIDETNDD